MWYSNTPQTGKKQATEKKSLPPPPEGGQTKPEPADDSSSISDSASNFSIPPKTYAPIKNAKSANIDVTPAFYSSINILSTVIGDFKYKLLKGRYEEYRQHLLTHSRKYGYTYYIQFPSETTWETAREKYPMAINCHHVYLQYREETLLNRFILFLLIRESIAGVVLPLSLLSLLPIERMLFKELFASSVITSCG